MRPVDDHLVGLGEAALRREDGPGVADRHVVAEEAPTRATAAAKSMAPKTSIRGLRRERPHEDPHALAAALAVGAVGQRRVVAGREQPERVVVDRGVGARSLPRGPTARRGGR